MSKKKKNKKKVSKKSKLEMSRNSSLMSLKCHCKNIQDTNERLLKKIEEVTGVMRRVTSLILRGIE